MVTLNLDTAIVKYANETTTEITTQFSFKIANPGDKPIYVEYEITGQGNNLWTFDDGTTVKRETLGGGSVLNKVFTIKPSSIPSATEKDSITVKVRYYKDDQYSNLLGDDTINITAYLFIQQSDMTWGNSSANLDESTVVYDDWESFTKDGNTAIGKYNVAKFAYQYSLYTDEGYIYPYLLKLRGYYDPKYAYFKNVSDDSYVVDKIISLAMWKSTSSYTLKLQNVYSPLGTTISKSVGDTMKKYLLVQPSSDWYSRMYQDTNTNVYLYLDGLVIFNKF